MWMYNVPDWKACMVYNGISFHQFDGFIDPGAVRERFHVGPIDPTILFVGRMTSQKGPAGGFALAMPSEKITLLHIVEAIDGLGFMHDCMMGFATCSGKNPCAAHETWANVRGQVHEMLVNQSVAEIARGMRKPVFVAGR